MAIDQKTVLQHLKRVFPDGIIYRETYTLKTVGAAFYGLVRSLAKAEGLSAAQWLQSNGFFWRETGYVEPDMLYSDAEWRTDSAVNLCDSILRRYPLIGEYECTDAEFNLLFSKADSVFQKMCRDGSILTRSEELVLTVATVSILKKRGAEESENSGDNTFWSYIYQQYGFNPGNSELATQRVYKKFRDAISNTLSFYRRFFAPADTMRYYTSLLLHAIAPKDSIENLFDILFDYYIKNLDYQYVPEDPGYQTLVKGMQARWNDKCADVQLRSSAVMSGLKALFLNRPGYMAVLCDSLVKEIDSLLRGEDAEMEGRWAHLLQDWFQKKSSTERSQLLGKKRERRTEFVATSTDRIYIQYGMENGRVGLEVPRIRLAAVGETRPVLSIFQGPREIFRSEMSVVGNDLGLTTRRRFVALEETAADFSAALKLCAEIEYLGDTLYSSGSRLFRNVLCFDSAGNERSIQSGTAYLFSDDGKIFNFADEDGMTMEDHPGQLYRVNLDLVGAVTVDGAELFADEKQAGKPRIYSNISPLRDISLYAEGRNYQIYSSPFSLALNLPETENTLRYQITIDGQRIFPLGENDSGAQLFPVPESVSGLHTARLVDLAQSLVVLEYCYTILPGLSWCLDKPRYLETEDELWLIMQNEGSEQRLLSYRVPESTLARSEPDVWGNVYEFEVPTVSCSFGEHSAFKLPEDIWFQDVHKDIFSSVQLPSGWQGQLYLGARNISANSEGNYEIGNLLHSGQRFADSEPLWLSLRSPEAVDQILLTQIHFSPVFIAVPVVFRANELQWRPKGCFIGEKTAVFRVELDGPQRLLFDALGIFDKLLCREADLRHGRYQVQVYQKAESLFAGPKEMLVYSGELVVGDENEFRFEGSELVIKGAIYWDWTSDEMKYDQVIENSGIIDSLQFVKMSTPSGEPFDLPEYTGRLCFERGDGTRSAYSYQEEKHGRAYEKVNPVFVWIVSKNRVIIRDEDQDALYYDMLMHAIVNRKLPESAKYRLQNPDYFEYETRRTRNV